MVSLDFVIEKVRNYLDLESNVNIDRNTKIFDLAARNGETLEPIDLLCLLQNLGIKVYEYCSGERLNERGVEMMKFVVMQEKIPEDFDGLAKKIENSASDNTRIITTSEVAEKITPGYLLRIAEYDAQLRKVA